jgi:hypothetical protein
MRILLFLALLALVFSSQPSFLRNLQETEEVVSPPPEDNNGLITTNDTANSTDNEAASNNTDNEGDNETPVTPAFDYGQLFDASGTYTLISSNCTIVEFNSTEGEGEDSEVITTNSSLCIPELVLLVDPETNMIEVTFVYPLDVACGNYSGETMNFTYPYANGIFMDQVAMFTGVFFINNRTVGTLANDTYNQEAGMCWAIWSPINSSNDSNTSNDSESSNEADGLLTDTEAGNDSESGDSSNTTTTKLWEGAWNVVSYNSTNTSASVEESCCVPDSSVLVYEDTSSIFYMFRAPDCPACGTVASTVSVHNVTITNGVGLETAFGQLSYLYMINNTVVFVSPQCYIVYEQVVPRVCNETGNTTNDTIAEGEGDGETVAPAGEGETVTPAGEGETVTPASGEDSAAPGGEGETDTSAGSGDAVAPAGEGEPVEPSSDTTVPAEGGR